MADDEIESFWNKVGDADTVFIVRREGPPWRTATPQVVELGPNDMVVTVQRGDNHEPLLHGTRVYVNGSQIRFVQEFRIEVSTEESHVPVLDFAILSPDAEGISDGMRRRNEISLNNLTNGCYRRQPFVRSDLTGCLFGNTGLFTRHLS